MDPLAQTPLRLQPEIGDLPKLTAYIEAFSEAHGVPMADTMALTLAAEELFANTLHHSHSPVTFIEFQLDYADGALTAIYTDDASPFDPTRKSAPDTTLAVEDRGIGGLGIHLIRRTMALFHYERAGNRNVITFARQNPSA